MTFAGFWRRLIALAIDLAVTQWPLYVISRHEIDDKLVYAIVVFPSFLLFPIYRFICHALYGQTLGKWITRIRVVRLDNSPVTWGASCLRSSVLFLVLVANAIADLTSQLDIKKIMEKGDETSALLVLYLLSVLFSTYGWTICDALAIFFNKRRRALHDLMADTVVKNKPPRNEFKRIIHNLSDESTPL